MDQCHQLATGPDVKMILPAWPGLKITSKSFARLQKSVVLRLTSETISDSAECYAGL